MNSNTNTKSKNSKSKHTKGPDNLPAREEISGLNLALLFVKPAKNPDVEEEVVNIKMRINNNISKDERTNCNTNSSKIIDTVGSNSTDVVETICAIELYIFTPYALKGSLLTKKHPKLFSRVLKGTAKIQLEEAIQNFQNQVLDEYYEEATQEVLSLKKSFDFLKEEKIREDGEEE